MLVLNQSDQEECDDLQNDLEMTEGDRENQCCCVAGPAASLLTVPVTSAPGSHNARCF